MLIAAYFSINQKKHKSVYLIVIYHGRDIKINTNELNAHKETAEVHISQFTTELSCFNNKIYFQAKDKK